MLGTKSLRYESKNISNDSLFYNYCLNSFCGIKSAPMKLIKNKGIILSRNRRKFQDILYESADEICRHFPGRKRYLYDIEKLYEKGGMVLHGFVERHDSTMDEPMFIHVIDGDNFDIRKELTEDEFYKYKR